MGKGCWIIMTGLDQWFSKHGPWTVSIRITSKLVRNAPPQTYWNRYWGCSSAISVLRSPPGEGDHAKVGEHWLRLWQILIQPLKLEHDYTPEVAGGKVNTWTNLGLWQQERCLPKPLCKMLQGIGGGLEASREVTCDSVGRMGGFHRAKKGILKSGNKMSKGSCYSSLSPEPLNWLGFSCWRWSKNSFPQMPI